MSIKVSHVSFSYGHRRVLEDICFNVKRGEFLSILGPNGAGKSTLFRCILGLLPGYLGEVIVNGKNMKKVSVREAARQIAYIPQSSHPAFHYSVLDMVLMGRVQHTSFFRNPGRADQKASLEALEKVGMGQMADQSFLTLSGGERQLVLMARALAQDAPILMLDEPTASLDFGNQLLVLKQARKLAEEGYTVIQTTHHPEQSYLFSNRILALHQGRVAADGEPQAVLTTELMRRLYNTDVNVVSLYEDAARICIPTEFMK